MRRIYGFALAALLAGAAGVEAGSHVGIDAVRARGYLTACVDPDNPPFARQAEPAAQGLEVELAALVARELGVEARFHWRPSVVGALRPLRNGDCELFFGLPTDRRFTADNPWVAVTRPYFAMGHALVLPGAAAALPEEALAGKRVAVQLASMAEYHALFVLGAERGLYRTPAEVVDAVASGQASAGLLWYPMATWQARRHPSLRVRPITGDGLAFDIAAGVRRRDPGLFDAVDGALARLLASGRIREVLVRHDAVARMARGTSPFVRVQAKDLAEQGRSLFSNYCSRCHGGDGGAGGLGGIVPVLKNYDTSEDGRKKFFRVALEGRKYTPMVGFKGILTNAEIEAIFTFLTTLPRS